MFGTVMANKRELSEEDSKRYSAAYCGVCHALHRRYGSVARLSLNYDIAFLALMLELTHSKPSETKKAFCVCHTVKGRDYVSSETVDYCADMNVLLFYYQLLDDKNDDGSLRASVGETLLEKAFSKACALHPEKSSRIAEKMRELSELEQKDCRDPDLMGRVFGEVLGEAFAYENDEHLREFGASLGKFIYLADACIDLKKDLKRKQYNPMVSVPSSLFDNILNGLMTECTGKLKAFPKAYNDSLISNILYSGTFLKYEYTKARTKK